MGDYRPSHAGLCVSDLERAVRFYCEGLGFERAERFDMDSTALPGLDRSLEVHGPATITSQFIQNDTMRIELLHFTAPAAGGAPSARRNELGLTHLSFYVDDIDRALPRLLELGGTLLPDTRQHPGIDLVFLADPDGTRVELMAAPA